jgi:hypothetical protein
MPKYNARARKLRGQGRIRPSFMQFFHYVKRSTSYHSLGRTARALLTEIHDRFTGCNNGMIVLSVREAAYELGCSQSTASRAGHELDDAELARPTKIGAWRGKQATEWRLMWLRCDQTGDLPRRNWRERPPYQPMQPPARKPLSDAERARRYRRRKNGQSTDDRHEYRHDELHQGSTEVAPREHRCDVSCTTRAKNGNSSINASRPSCTRRAHIDIYHRQGHRHGHR